MIKRERICGAFAGLEGISLLYTVLITQSVPQTASELAYFPAYNKEDAPSLSLIADHTR
jgi:hypothetical protein